MRWLFPGSTITVEAPCLDCAEPMTVVLRDEEILDLQPATIVGYSSAEVGGDAASRPFR
ncbi:MAG: hypothetical protein ACR2QO_00045 [Acidimicrobiales bacterium]